MFELISELFNSIFNILMLTVSALGMIYYFYKEKLLYVAISIIIMMSATNSIHIRSIQNDIKNIQCEVNYE